MIKNTRRVQRGAAALTREHIIEAAIDLLDRGGEGGLTFRALAARLSTGPGAIYYHVANKDDLLCAACDSVVTAALPAGAPHATPPETIRTIALALFDAIDAHPWAGTELTRASWKMPMVRILERLGQQAGALGLPRQSVQPATFVLLNYIIGVAVQNAVNGQTARREGWVRTQFLQDVATTWDRLDAHAYPFVRGLTAQLRAHDDRVDFLAAVDLILAGLVAAGPA